MAIIAPKREQERKLISIENTKFIYKTNFSGDPARDNYGSTARKANIIIPDHMQARELIDAGFNVKTTKPRLGDEEDFVPEYYVSINVNYDTEWPPKIYLVSGKSKPVLLDETSVDAIDKCYVLNVNAVLNPYHNKKTGTHSLYVRTLYVEQNVEDDPFAHRYFGNNDEDEPPFDVD